MSRNHRTPILPRQLRSGLSCAPHLIFCAAAVLLIASPAIADPGPLGPEYAAEERALPGPEWWRSCENDRGTMFSATRVCSDEDCKEAGDIHLDLHDANGTELGTSIRVNVNPATMQFPIHVTCHATGWIVVQWRDMDARCYVHRVFDQSGRPLGNPQQFLEHASDCRRRPDIGVHDDGSFVTAWSTGFWEGGSAVLARRFDVDGAPASAPVVVSRSSDGWRERAKVAVDPTGSALVVWRRTGSGDVDDPGGILARFLDAAGEPIGEELTVNTFAYGEISEPVVAAEGEGRFEILWSNWLQGGRVGRRLAVSANRAAGVETAASAASAPADMPSFGAPRIMDSAASRLRDADFRRIVAGSGAAWVLAAADARYQRSYDDGGNWDRPTPPTPPTEGRYHTVALGADGKGGWVALHASRAGAAMQVSRSTDEARTWSGPARLPEIERPTTCAGCQVERAAVRGSTAGTWIAAVGRTSSGGDRVDVIRSTNDARKWRSIGRIGTDLGFGKAGFDLETDGSGTWIMMWADEHLWMSRSTDDGVRWSAPDRLADDIVCTTCRLHDRYSRLELATDGSGGWAAIFASPRHRAERFGHDGDVFILRSADDGGTWTAPKPVNPSARRDGARDADPTLATDGAGRWLAAWTTHRPTGAGDDLDADVVLALSTDGGTTWSDPVPTTADPGARTGLDWMPHLAARTESGWMLAWSSRDVDSAEPLSMNRVLLAGADADCGNGRVEIAEQCDDGNVTDGDGCDHNCTITACGNGVETPGEECDDGNVSASDVCMQDCLPPICGDGFVQGIEECDDANDVDTDDCPTTCKDAACGDGLVHETRERCDDGNDSNTDACTNQCQYPRCGDGYVHEGVEACDDGDRQGVGGCPAGCRDPVCGDGFTSYPVEECDYLDPLYADVCSEECKLPEVCGDANIDGEVTSADGLRILRHSVGIRIACPTAACDMNGSRTISVSDAAMALGKAVGIEVGERCSIGTGPIVFWTDDPRSMGALQFNIDYAATGGQFLGSGQDAECEMLFGGVQVDFDEFEDDPEPVLGFGLVNDLDEQGLMIVALTSIEGFSGPLDLVRCNFELPEGASDVRFGIHIVDVSDERTNALIPPPQIGYRLE